VYKQGYAVLLHTHPLREDYFALEELGFVRLVRRRRVLVLGALRTEYTFRITGEGDRAVREQLEQLRLRV
jgi:hypothetical protein